MKVKTLKYGEIRIRWQYNLFNGDRDITKAFLEKKEDKDAKVLVEVAVARHPKEKYDKEKARYFALQSLLQNAFCENKLLAQKPGGEKVIVTYRTPENKQDREAIWEAYKTRSKKIER